MKIYSYSNGSESARKLADELGINLISHNNSVFVGAPEKVVINWGSANLPEEVLKCKVLNKNIQANKYEMMKILSTKFDVPAFTKDIEEAKAWEDIEMEVSEKEGVYYTKLPYSAEFRLHQFPGKTARVQYKNVHENIHEVTRTLIKKTAEEVRKFLDLDFCAITFGWTGDRFYIISVNTAPELDDDLARVYAENIRKLV
jgi:hypothetical protein